MDLDKSVLNAEVCLVVGILIIFGGLGFWVVGSAKDQSPSLAAERIQSVGQKICTEEIDERILGSAKGPSKTNIGTSNFTWTFAADGSRITATSRVDGKNIFGALLASTWVCKLELNPDELKFVSLVED